jgi:threonine dehydrogenase-like Zn-dependent dehydrogenase
LTQLYLAGTAINAKQEGNIHAANFFLEMDSMVTHHFGLEETQKAFELAANYKNGVMKTMISID